MNNLSYVYSHWTMLAFRKCVGSAGRNERRSRLFTASSVSKPVEPDSLDLNAADWARVFSDTYTRPVAVRLVQRHQRITLVVEPITPNPRRSSPCDSMVPESVVGFLRRWNQQETLWSYIGRGGGSVSLPMEIPLEVLYMCKDPSNR